MKPLLTKGMCPLTQTGKIELTKLTKFYGNNGLPSCNEENRRPAPHSGSGAGSWGNSQTWLSPFGREALGEPKGDFPHRLGPCLQIEVARCCPRLSHPSKEESQGQWQVAVDKAKLRQDENPQAARGEVD